MPTAPRATDHGHLPARFGMALAGLVAVLALGAGLAGWLLSPDDLVAGQLRRIATGAIFAVSYLGLAVGRLPGLRLDRAGIALAGAALMAAAGALSPGEALGAVDPDTMMLLLGMMIVVACLRLSGCFAIATAWVVVRAHSPLLLLVAVIAVSGLFSAFLVNDAVCLVLAPLVLDLARRVGRRPGPYLLTVAMASNIGSVATITGNPQNIMIGSFSGIPFARFALALGPVALAGLAVALGLIAVMYRVEFAGGRLEAPALEVAVDRAAATRAVVATLLLIALFFAGVAPARAAIAIGGLLVLAGWREARRICAEIDWALLLMFAGLFVIVAGARHVLLTPGIIADAGRLRLDQVPVLSALTVALSNLVSNVPAVLVLKPFVEALPDQHHAWLVVAMASTLAGNLTLLGSIANLIVVQKAAASGVTIGFREHLRIGLPLTLATLAIGAAWLSR
jgi:Na+/H+ antiporter NhaD/arsenite permease-like protein